MLHRNYDRNAFSAKIKQNPALHDNRTDFKLMIIINIPIIRRIFHFTSELEIYNCSFEWKAQFLFIVEDR